MKETRSVTEDEFAILDDGGELLALEALDPGDDHATIDVVIGGRRQAISRASIEALQRALLNFLNTGTFNQEA